MIAGADQVVLIADVGEVLDDRRRCACAAPSRARPVVTDAPLPAACARLVDAAGIEVMHRMKLTIVGGGGFRVPLVYGALLRAGASGSGSTRSCCTTSTTARLARIAHVLDGLAAEHGAAARRSATTTDLVDAVEGADFVFCAIRVGQLEGRVIDEDVPLGARRARAGDDRAGRHLLRAAHDPGDGRARRDDRASTRRGAWLINFTNPAGMVTEAVQQVLGDRAVGICDSPSGLCRRVAARARARPARAVVRLLRPQPPRLAAGRARRRAASCCRELLADDERLARFEEGRLFGGEWLRSLGMIPNEYLYYFYYAADTVDAIRARARRRAARSCSSSSARSTPATARRRPDALAAWRATRHDRERTYMAEARSAAGDDGDARRRASDNGGYEGEAMAVVEAIAQQHARGADPQHREPLGAAVPGRSAPWSRCRASSAAPGRCRWRWARCPPTRGRSSRR